MRALEDFIRETRVLMRKVQNGELTVREAESQRRILETEIRAWKTAVYYAVAADLVVKGSRLVQGVEMDIDSDEVVDADAAKPRRRGPVRTDGGRSAA